MNKRGRPAKPANKRRENRIDSYFCDLMYEQIKSEAEQRGLSISSWVRMIVTERVEHSNFVERRNIDRRMHA